MDTSTTPAICATEIIPPSIDIIEGGMLAIAVVDCGPTKTSIPLWASTEATVSTNPAHRGRLEAICFIIPANSQ